MTRILVVDDDPTVREVVRQYLLVAGMDVVEAATGPEALERAAGADLVVLDLMLPGLDGHEVFRRLRAAGNPVPVIMLTARGEVDDRILGLEAGACDYVTKPFSARELVLRVQSVLRLREVQPASTDVLVDGDLELNLAARTLHRDGRAVPLSLREFDLLAFLMQHPGQVHTRDELMREVWGWGVGDPSTVTVHVRRLRGKVEDDPSAPTRIVTAWGHGYRWDSRNSRPAGTGVAR